MLILRIIAVMILTALTAIMLAVILVGAIWLAPALIAYAIAIFAIFCLWLYLEIRPSPIKRVDR